MQTAPEVGAVKALATQAVSAYCQMQDRPTSQSLHSSVCLRLAYSVGKGPDAATSASIICS
jgi:hypothetical protein